MVADIFHRFRTPPHPKAFLLDTLVLAEMLQESNLSKFKSDEVLRMLKMTNKLNREIYELRVRVEAAKYDVIKYCIGTLVSISAVGLVVIRIIL